MNPSRASSSALVIGGGVVGLFTAWRLVDAGFAVTVIDRDRIGGSASWAAGGILSPLPPWQAPEAVWALAAESMAAYPAIAAELYEATGIDPEWWRCGMQVLHEAEPAAALQWGRAQALQIEVGPTAALHLPSIAQVRSPRLLKALRAYLSQRGVQWCEHAAVVQWVVQADLLQAAQTANGQRWSADVFALCAGAWSAPVAAALGTAVAVQPIRGQMILFDTPVGLLDQITLSGPRYLIPRRDGRIVAGSTLEPVGFDEATTLTARVELFEQACALLPALQHHSVSDQWAALRPATEQGVPVIARADGYRNLFINTGHFRNGITLAPASAARLIQQLKWCG